MPKEFFSERDIEDLVNSGVSSLVITDDIVLTDLAWEKAKKLGFILIQEDDAQPSALLRPNTCNNNINRTGSSALSNQQDEIKKKVIEAVIARLGKQVDPDLLDNVIDRILKDQKIC